jgi:hypothetical protein
MKKLFYTRGELLDLFWSEPLLDLAKQFGISDVALGKKYKSLGLPLPGRGHWAKVPSRRPENPPLPARQLGTHEIVTLAFLQGSGSLEEADKMLLAGEIPPPPAFDESMDFVRESLERQVAKLKIKPTMSPVHPGIQGLLDEDKLRDEVWRKHGYQSWEEPYFKSKYEQRRLKIVNAVLLGLAKVSARVTVRGKDPGSFGVRVGEVYLEFTVDTANTFQNRRPYDSWWRRHSRPDRSDAEPLIVEIHLSRLDKLNVTRRWVDAEGLIESQLADIVVGIVLAAEAYVRASDTWMAEQFALDKARLEKRNEELHEARLKEARDRVQAERQAAMASLRSQIVDFTFARDVRHYVAALESRVSNQGDAEVTSAFSAWRVWAIAVADAMDPALTLAFLDRQDDPETSSEPSRSPSDFEARVLSSTPAWNPNAWHQRKR